jgi:hypothetical protein
MNSKRIISIITSLLVLLLNSCTSHGNDQISGTQFLEGVNDVNKSITLGNYDISQENVISLPIINHTNTPILFPPDLRIKIYDVSSETTWVEIYNQFKYHGELIIYPFNQGGLGAMTFIPVISDSISEIRVVIIGNILLENNITGDLVAAYKDIKLSH